MIVITSEDLVKEEGKRAYTYKKKHNISNDPNKRKISKQDEKESNNCKKKIIILLLLLLIFLILFLGIFFGLRIKKRHNNVDNNLDNDFLDYNNGSILVNGKQIKYSFKATYQTKKDNEKIKLMNYIPNKITEMVVDGIEVNEGNDNFYTFPLSGNHTVYFLINITNCTSLNSLFADNTNLTSIAFTSEFNTENVEDMEAMFDCCTSLVSIKFSNLNTKKVKNMNCMLH